MHHFSVQTDATANNRSFTVNNKEREREEKRKERKEALFRLSYSTLSLFL